MMSKISDTIDCFNYKRKDRSIVRKPLTQEHFFLILTVILILFLTVLLAGLMSTTYMDDL